jgi:hypothetical protein
MARFAVGHYNMHTNELKIEIVTAESWKEAIGLHSLFSGFWENFAEWPEDYKNCVTESNFSLESVKEFVFNIEEGLDVVEIPS